MVARFTASEIVLQRQPMDILSKSARSERMKRIRSNDTQPELAVRRIVHALGYRYRLHVGKLPGRPDLVFASRRKVIFVHGCFWHRHEGCPKTQSPKSRLDFWLPKLERNRLRDAKNQQTLTEAGWKFLIVWECETRRHDTLSRRLRDFLES